MESTLSAFLLIITILIREGSCLLCFMDGKSGVDKCSVPPGASAAYCAIEVNGESVSRYCANDRDFVVGCGVSSTGLKQCVCNVLGCNENMQQAAANTAGGDTLSQEDNIYRSSSPQGGATPFLLLLLLIISVLLHVASSLLLL